MSSELETEVRSGTCAVMGLPNVGKSTLVNALIGEKIAITRPTPGTTRTSMIGHCVRTVPPTHIALVDTPGVMASESVLGRVTQERAREGQSLADVALLVVDASRKVDHGTGIPVKEQEVLSAIDSADQPAICVLNKIDRRRDKRGILSLIERYRSAYPFRAFVPISATSGLQLSELIAEVRRWLPVVPSLDVKGVPLSDRPERFFVAEYIREAAMRRTRQEVPHGIAVWVDTFEADPGLTRISATLVVERPGHKKIVIGKGGCLLREIGTEARREIERLIDSRVYLELYVRVIPGWTKDPDLARRLVEGLDAS